jgi:hypothetical protein
MSDIGFASNALVISRDLRDKMTDNTNNWKVRTDTIDEIFNLVSEKIIKDQQLVLSQSEMLMEFLVSLLNDQNFKIVLTTLMVISMSH